MTPAATHVPVTIKGYAIVMDGPDSRQVPGYGDYTYFALSDGSAEDILDDVREEHPELRVVPAELVLRHPGDATLQSALESFVRCVETAGGLVPDSEGSSMPGLNGAEDWIDLAEAYESACAVLGKKPKYYEDEEQ